MKQNKKLPNMNDDLFQGFEEVGKYHQRKVSGGASDWPLCATWIFFQDWDYEEEDENENGEL